MSNEDWCKKNCPYNTDCSCDGICNFVLSLLKEQEAVKVEKRKEEAEWNICSNCGGHLIHKWSYCPHCGRKVRWNA